VTESSPGHQNCLKEPALVGSLHFSRWLPGDSVQLPPRLRTRAASFSGPIAS
jgi:hypothetical protein